MRPFSPTSIDQAADGTFHSPGMRVEAEEPPPPANFCSFSWSKQPPLPPSSPRPGPVEPTARSPQGGSHSPRCFCATANTNTHTHGQRRQRKRKQTHSRRPTTTHNKDNRTDGLGEAGGLLCPDRSAPPGSPAHPRRDSIGLNRHGSSQSRISGTDGGGARRCQGERGKGVHAQGEGKGTGCDGGQALTAVRRRWG